MDYFFLMIGFCGMTLKNHENLTILDNFYELACARHLDFLIGHHHHHHSEATNRPFRKVDFGLQAFAGETY